MCWEEEHKTEIDELHKIIKEEKIIRRIKRDKYKRRVEILKEEVSRLSEQRDIFLKRLNSHEIFFRDLCNLLNNFYPKISASRYKVERFDNAIFKINDFISIIQYLEKNDENYKTTKDL